MMIQYDGQMSVPVSPQAQAVPPGHRFVAHTPIKPRHPRPSTARATSNTESHGAGGSWTMLLLLALPRPSPCAIPAVRPLQHGQRLTGAHPTCTACWPRLVHAAQATAQTVSHRRTVSSKDCLPSTALTYLSWPRDLSRAARCTAAGGVAEQLILVGKRSTEYR